VTVSPPGAWCVQVRTAPGQERTHWVDDVDAFIATIGSGFQYRYTRSSSKYLEKFLALPATMGPAGKQIREYGWITARTIGNR
jgi:hypothetical protein